MLVLTFRYLQFRSRGSNNAWTDCPLYGFADEEHGIARMTCRWLNNNDCFHEWRLPHAFGVNQDAVGVRAEE